MERIKIFLFLFISLFLLEYAFPRIKKFYYFKRIIRNLSLPLVYHVIAKFFVPFSAVGSAYWASNNNWGILNYLNLPSVFKILFSVIILDCIIYWQHRIFHVVDWLWNYHRVHHVDRVLDVSSALRFHPVEFFLSTVIKVFSVIIIGASPEGVILFEIILNGMAMFNHANIKFSTNIDFILRKVIVTPDFHRSHHSNQHTLMNSNFGFNFAFWDYLFGSYRTIAYEDHEKMQLGISEIEQEKSLLELLKLPFKGY